MSIASITGMTTAAALADVRPPELTDAQLERILAAAEEAHSASTRRAYTGAWEHFVAWAEAQRHSPLPAAPETVAAYLAERADDGLSRATLAIARAAIGHAHKDAAHDDPTAHDVVRKVLRGLNRRISKGLRRSRRPVSPQRDWPPSAPRPACRDPGRPAVQNRPGPPKGAEPWISPSAPSCGTPC